ncbi:zinc finger protein 846-like [Anthonomus grandis grandis]|uniref:zinc finger protein 846-like n=1 Tax=Anthonomus grandis grandis TaxID=2921223 RepID=UPI002165FDB8|nr:zinc finger protein 846-like [Anthonomus grandis grandis]
MNEDISEGQIPENETFQASSDEDAIHSPVSEPIINHKCRICWQPSENTKVPFSPLTAFFGKERPRLTIKKVLLFCVPKLTLKNKDFICDKCFKCLETVYSFIKQCLETESQILGLKGSKGTVMDFSESLLSSDNVKQEMEQSLDTLQATENIHIKSEFNPDLDDINAVSSVGSTVPIYDESELPDHKDLASMDYSDFNEKQIDGESSSKVPNGILDLFNFSCKNSRCLVVNKDITKEETKDLVDSGINVIQMSTNPNTKKRVIYIGRDLVECVIQCHYCSITFFSAAEAEDHNLEHKKGNVNLNENIAGTDIFRCPECPAEFMSQTDFRIHSYYFHKEPRPFVCPQCNKRFRTHKDLQSHTKYTVKGSPRCKLLCSRCGKEFSRMSVYEEHMEISEASASCDIVKCKTCGESMAKTILNEHMQTYHETTSSALCSVCGKCLPNTKVLSKHMSVAHSKSSGLPCPKCDRRFSQKSNLTKHLNTVHGQFIHTCDQCPRKFKHHKYLSRHVEVQHKNKEETKDASVTCDKCGLMFKYITGLRQHIRNIHEGIKEFGCDLCGERFARADYLLRHKNHHDLYMQHVCEICKTSFRTDWCLRSHMLVGHDEDGRPLKKNASRRQFAVDGEDNSEYKISKETGKRYKLSKSETPKVCPICQRVLSNAQTLRKHYRGHLKLLQKKCPKCDTYFSSPSNLSKHLKRHDDPRFDLRCRICHVIQDSKEDLEVHMEKNHKDMKHKCHICKEGFGRKHILTNHILSKHPEEYEKRQELFSLLVSQEVEDVPIKTYQSKRVIGEKSKFTEKEVEKFLNKVIGVNNELDYSKEEEQEQEKELQEDQSLTDELEECNVFDGGSDLNEEL